VFAHLDTSPKSWLSEHSMFILFGIFIDVLNDHGPLLSSLLAGVSFMRLFLRLTEKNEPQLWTWPNLVTSVRILGVFSLAAYALQQHQSSKKNDEIPGKNVNLEDDFIYSDKWLAFYGSIFVALDFFDGFLARRLNQCTELGARLDAQGDALGTSFLALTLLTKDRMNSFLAVHMACAAFLYSLFPRICPPRIVRKFPNAKHPHARTSAGLMAFCAIAAVILPAFTDRPSDLSGTYSLDLVALFANLSGLINLVSFTLSYIALFKAATDTTSHEHKK
jgi:phosphatidylglycerophosphate synthase